MSETKNTWKDKLYETDNPLIEVEAVSYTHLAEMYHHLILLRKMRRSLQSRSHLTGKGRRFMRILQKHFRGKQKNLLIMEIKS